MITIIDKRTTHEVMKDERYVGDICLCHPMNPTWKFVVSPSGAFSLTLSVEELTIITNKLIKLNDR